MALNIVSSVGARAVGLVGTLVITRFIAPHEYGAVTAAVIVVYTLDAITRAGLLQFVLARPDAPPSTVFHVSFYHLLLGVMGLSGLVVTADFWCGLFAPEGTSPRDVAKYIPGMCLAVTFERVGVVAERILCRDMRFGIVSVARGLSELVYTGVSITLAAFFDLQGHAIIWGNVAQWFVVMAMLGLAANWREWLLPHRITWQETREVFRFGLPLAVGDLSHFASRKWDNLIIDRMFGHATMGYYNLAYNLADIPATQIGEHIGDVLLPTFARMDKEQAKDALIRGTRLLALIVFPLAVGLGAVAESATHAIFDARWHSIAPMLTILCALSIMRPIGWTVAAYQIADGQTIAVGLLELIKLIILLALIYVLAKTGDIYWACGAVGFSFGLHAVGSAAVVRQRNQISMAKLLLGLLPPLVACVPVAAAVYGVRHGLLALGLESRAILLVIEIVVGAIVFIPSALILAPTGSRELLRLVRRTLNSKLGRDGEVEEQKKDD
jgi:PST family polysaccharide transporter